MSFYLFLDDIRKPHQVTWVDLPLFGWTIVRNYNEFIETIKKNGLPEFISFDHDLALEHYPLFEENIDFQNPHKIPYDSYIEKTGYDCVKWLINYCIENKFKFPNYTIHSMNPIGKQNIESLIESFKKSQNEITDGFGNFWSKTCAMCGNDSMEVVRSGKVQCYKCG